MPSKIKKPWSIPSPDTTLNAIDIHVFADFSTIGTRAAAYVVSHQLDHVNQHLIASKSQLAKQNIAVYMVSKLVEDIKSVLTYYNIRDIYGWTDSCTTLAKRKGGL